jgi:hypothetical protein
MNVILSDLKRPYVYNSESRKGDGMNPDVFAPALMTLFGVLAAFAGYRTIRSLRPLYGLLAGATTGMMSVSQMTDAPWAVAGGALAGGILGLILIIAVYWFYIFLTGALIGGAAAQNVFRLVDMGSESGWQAWAVLGAMALVGLLAMKFEKQLMVFGTALLGGLLVSLGAYDLGLRMDLLSPQVTAYLTMGLGVVLMLLGSRHQMKYAEKHPDEDPSKDRKNK